MKAMIKLVYSPQKPLPTWVVKLKDKKVDFGNDLSAWDKVENFLIENGIAPSEIEFLYEGGEPGRKDFKNMFKYFYKKTYMKKFQK